MDSFDVVVIGAGPGGYPAAIRAAQRGAKVAIVEKEKLGGTCLNWGCIPTKTLIASSELFWQIKSADSFGIKVDHAEPDYAAMVARKDEIVKKLNGGVGQLLKGNGVTLLNGTGALLARNRVKVAPAGGDPTPIEAGRVIIATGSTSAMPGFLPKHERVVESRGLLDMTALPASMIIMGGGVIGCEFACMYAQLGVNVTVVELLEDILLVLDADVRRELKRHMEKELGIKVTTGAGLEDIEADSTSVRGRAGQEPVEAEMLLVAVGRNPVTGGLGLDDAGVTTDDQGFIGVDEYGCTKAAGVYAIGDVTGGTLLAHAATSHGITAAENAVERANRKNDPLIPYCIFTSPEIGSVGLTEESAKRKAMDVTTGKFMFGALGKAMAINHAAGFVKWIADPGTGQLLGAQAIGPHATELIAEATLAIRSELTAKELGHTIHSHPTLAESWMEAAHGLLGEAIHAIPRRR